LPTASVLGDVDSIAARLATILEKADTHATEERQRRDEHRAAQTARKEALAVEAEEIAASSTQWKASGDRLREILDEWRTITGLDRKTDDALWKRYSSARETFNRRRGSHFADLDRERAGVRQAKEALCERAESLSDSTDWGPTGAAFRDLLVQWKAAGRTAKDVDDALWKRFRGAQDAFFGARDAANAALDAEFADNAVVKDALILEAEALLPVKDVDAAKKAFRDIADRWDAAGKVPRDRMKELEGRIRTVENAIRSIEDDAWKRSDPEKSARANDMVAKLEDAIAEVERDLEKARAAGNDKKVKDLEDNLASRQSFLEMARRASADYGG
jgi:Domain of Unknown Function (DUF349)